LSLRSFEQGLSYFITALHSFASCFFKTACWNRIAVFRFQVPFEGARINLPQPVQGRQPFISLFIHHASNGLIAGYA
ncbi:hypothetical protein, partial [Paenibacillus pasadenensis]|uniref:hypothetical protein n=1 Tax=Paenibacillus pasadenensis TaxID=217090 RepID=UPI001C3FC79D